MAMNQRSVSSHFPYLPVLVEVPLKGDLAFTFVGNTFLDTGFDGDVIVSASLLVDRKEPDGYVLFRLADSSRIIAPAYLGAVQLGPMGTFPAGIIAFGDAPIIGRGVIDRFAITLDHGQQVIVEP